MSETELPRDETTGQFTPSLDDKFGREYNEASAGFKSMPENTRPDPEERTFATAQEAADHLAAQREAERSKEAEVTKVQYVDPTGEPIAPNETVSAERAAEDLTRFRAASADAAERTAADDFAEQIDRMRAEVLAKNPALAEHYGIEAPKAEPENIPDGVHPKVHQALQIPEVREVIAQRVNEADQARQASLEALNRAYAVQQATFAAELPELTSIPREKWPEAVSILNQSDPARVQKAFGALQQGAAIEQQLIAEQQHQARLSNQARLARQAEGVSKFRASLGNDQDQIRQVATDIGDYMKSAGVTEDELVDTLKDMPGLDVATVLRVLHDAAQHHRMKNTPMPRPTREIPNVVRPGVASISPASGDNSSRIASLKNQLKTASGNRALEIGAQIIAARRGAR